MRYDDLTILDPVHLQQFKRCPSLNDEPLLFDAMADIVKHHLDEHEVYSSQYSLKCPGCTNSTCRTIENPVQLN